MQIITHKLVPPSVFPNLSETKAKSHVYRLGVKLCPSMDLVATYPVLTRTSSASTTRKGYTDLYSDDDDANDEVNDVQDNGYNDDDDDGVSVDVWRFNGQKVFNVAVESEEGGKVEIVDVEWRSDGQIVAILSSDKIIRLVNSFSGKVVHRFSSLSTYTIPASPTSPRTRRSHGRGTASTSTSRPSTLSYTTHFSNPKSTGSLLHAAAAESSVDVDDLLSLNADITVLLKSPADLPRELANIDVESFLPRLSCLPPVGFGGNDVFSTRTSIDAIFHSSKKNIKSGTVDVLAVSNKDGIVTIRIFNSFEIGGVDLNSAAGLRRTPRLGRVLKMVSWPFSSEIFVVAEDSKRVNLHLLSIDLKFVAQNTLPVLATKATQLENLLRYLTQIQNQLTREVKTAFDLPGRYLRNINEDLEKQDGPGASFTTAAYHTVATGEVSGAFKEWLNEQVGERGVKRWEKSVGDCLELVRRLMSEAWCPAVERAGVVISRLSGLSSLRVQSDVEGPELTTDRKLVEALRDTIDVMAVCGEECLRDVIKEFSGFATFIKWLKWEVEASALEDTSERLDEMREGSEHGDITKVLDYIDKGPQESVVRRYLDPNSGVALTGQEEDIGFYVRFKERRKKEGSNFQPPTFKQLLERMRRQCDSLFEQIAQNLRQSIMTRYIVQLGGDADQAMLDTRVIAPSPDELGSGRVQVGIIARKKGDTASVLHHMVTINEDHAKANTVATHTLQPPDAEEVLDLMFADDESFMVLAKSAESSIIYKHPTDVVQTGEWEVRHQFEDGIMESGMKPARLEVNGRKKRRIVSVVDGDGKGYIVLDLDSGDAEEQTTIEEDEMMTG